MNPENNNYNPNPVPESSIPPTQSMPSAPVQPMSEQPIAPPVTPVSPAGPVQQVPQKKSSNIFVKVLAIIGGLVVLGMAIVLIVYTTSKKMVCTSPEGDITIMYNSKGITGYAANGVSYDLEGQQKYASKVGIEQYLKEFDDWFGVNTSGSCKR